MYLHRVSFVCFYFCFQRSLGIHEHFYILKYFSSIKRKNILLQILSRTRFTVAEMNGTTLSIVLFYTIYGSVERNIESLEKWVFFFQIPRRSTQPSLIFSPSCVFMYRLLCPKRVDQIFNSFAQSFGSVQWKVFPEVLKTDDFTDCDVLFWNFHFATAFLTISRFWLVLRWK